MEAFEIEFFFSFLFQESPNLFNFQCIKTFRTYSKQILSLPLWIIFSKCEYILSSLVVTCSVLRRGSCFIIRLLKVCWHAQLVVVKLPEFFLFWISLYPLLKTYIKFLSFVYKGNQLYFVKKNGANVSFFPQTNKIAIHEEFVDGGLSLSSSTLEEILYEVVHWHPVLLNRTLISNSL